MRRRSSPADPSSVNAPWFSFCVSCERQHPHGSQRCGRTCRVWEVSPVPMGWRYQLFTVRILHHEHFTDYVRGSSQQACGWGSRPSGPKAEQEGSTGQGSPMLLGLGR